MYNLHIQIVLDRSLLKKIKNLKRWVNVRLESVISKKRQERNKKHRKIYDYELKTASIEGLNHKSLFLITIINFTKIQIYSKMEGKYYI